MDPNNTGDSGNTEQPAGADTTGAGNTTTGTSEQPASNGIVENPPPPVEQKIENSGTVGRPIAITDDVLRKLQLAFMMGCTDLQACAYAQIGKTTLYDYQQEHPEFSEQKEEWKQNPILKAKATIYNNLNKEDIAKWYLEHKATDEFAKKTKQELAGVDGSPIAVSINYVKPTAEIAATENKSEQQPTDNIQTNPETGSSVGDSAGQDNQ